MPTISNLTHFLFFIKRLIFFKIYCFETSLTWCLTSIFWPDTISQICTLIKPLRYQTLASVHLFRTHIVTYHQPQKFEAKMKTTTSTIELYAKQNLKKKMVHFQVLFLLLSDVMFGKLDNNVQAMLTRYLRNVVSIWTINPLEQLEQAERLFEMSETRSEK